MNQTKSWKIDFIFKSGPIVVTKAHEITAQGTAYWCSESSLYLFVPDLLIVSESVWPEKIAKCL